MDEDSLMALITEKEPGNARTLLWNVPGSLPVAVDPHVDVLEYFGFQPAP